MTFPFLEEIIELASLQFCSLNILNYASKYFFSSAYTSLHSSSTKQSISPITELQSISHSNNLYSIDISDLSRIRHKHDTDSYGYVQSLTDTFSNYYELLRYLRVNVGVYAIIIDFPSKHKTTNNCESFYHHLDNSQN